MCSNNSLRHLYPQGKHQLSWRDWNRPLSTTFRSLRLPSSILPNRWTRALLLVSLRNVSGDLSLPRPTNHKCGIIMLLFSQPLLGARLWHWAMRLRQPWLRHGLQRWEKVWPITKSAISQNVHQERNRLMLYVLFSEEVWRLFWFLCLLHMESWVV